MIDLKALSKTYNPDSNPVHALVNIDLSIAEGEFVAIMGKSGSGKSTLMNILGLLDTPDTGTYRLADSEIQEKSGRELARIRNQEFGFVFQSFNLLSRTTVSRNVELPLIYNREFRGNRKDRVADVLKQVGLEHRSSHKSNELSGGEKQRVAIARALVNEPSVILADEPTGNLDTKTGQQIMGVLADLNQKGKTVIVVTHEDEVADYAKKVIVIEDGKIIEERNGHA